MSYYSSDGTYHGTWTQQGHGQSSEAYAQGARGYSSGSRPRYPQPGVDTAYCQYQGSGGGNAQYPYAEQGAPRAAYVQSTASSSGAYPVSSPTNGFEGVYQPGPYNAVPQYSQQSQGWSNTQQRPGVPGSQRMIHSHIVASPVAYSSQPLPLVAPRVNAGVDPGYSSSNAWLYDVSSVPGSSTGPQTATGRSTGSGAEYTVPCPYNCGTVLTGVHAVGNMTRHLKSQNCVASGKDKTRYDCPVQGCDKRYIRSDGLKVHLRKRHNISQVPDRSGSSEYDESGYEYS